MFSAINGAFSRLADHPDLGKLLLRLTIGILLLFHGVYKIQHGVGWIGHMLSAHGLPAFIAYGAYIGEVVAPAMVIIGFLTRPAGFIIAVNLVVAVLLVGMGQWTHRTGVGAWALESEMFYFMGGILIMLLGAGKYTLIRDARLQ
ncbi:DoxX family membrane protein [Izhakiella australiensis]|uniref:DoxX family membrane protein n=1 Tax=Izhakiella australiensis TaxID=1926881 RepID=A0A1S8YPS6_9GAMM|nr:DoxX family protein [Izhakiella australiensis]OON41139.1 DoxX family membrane protein [Izhakiella australiensis]